MLCVVISNFTLLLLSVSVSVSVVCYFQKYQINPT
nr:MAG TPA: hypothetical protein [Caudoviricetes sp.]